MPQANRSAAHENQFSSEVALGLQEADDPATPWISNEAGVAESATRRAQWLKRAQAHGGQATAGAPEPG